MSEHPGDQEERGSPMRVDVGFVLVCFLGQEELRVLRAS